MFDSLKALKSFLWSRNYFREQLLRCTLPYFGSGVPATMTAVVPTWTYPGHILDMWLVSDGHLLPVTPVLTACVFGFIRCHGGILTFYLGVLLLGTVSVAYC